MNILPAGNGASPTFISFAQLKEYTESDAIPRLANDPSLQRTLIPPSEKNDYTREDALLNQYMKQYRIDAKIKDGNIIYEEGSYKGLILPEMITDTELSAFLHKIATDGISNDIDWHGVKNDFGQIGVDFDNAEKLNSKIDYITSRYAVLKERIERDYSDDEMIGQSNILNQIIEAAKKTITDTFSNSIGSFYDEFGNAEMGDKLRDSLLKGIDNRIEEYQNYLSSAGDYYSITDDSEKWLLQDDGYMAARLRESIAGDNSTGTWEAGGQDQY